MENLNALYYQKVVTDINEHAETSPELQDKHQNACLVSAINNYRRYPEYASIRKLYEEQPEQLAHIQYLWNFFNSLSSEELSDLYLETLQAT